jgi:integrase
VGVKVRKRRGKWYVVIDYHGRRKSKCVGTREAAERVKREIEARLALGDMGMIESSSSPTFKGYAEKWFDLHKASRLKHSTSQGYKSLLDQHLISELGSLRLEEITRERARGLVADLAQKELSPSTVRNVGALLRKILNEAFEDGLIESNPAARLGLSMSAKQQRQAKEFLRPDEIRTLLQTVEEGFPQFCPLITTLVHTGMRIGEVLALEWGDVNFGENEQDPNRYIVVRRNFTHGQYATVKSGRERRVNMSTALRRVLMELWDQQMVEAFAQGREEIKPLMFPGPSGRPLDYSWFNKRVWHKALEAARLRRVTIHALRHSFASFLIQAGALLAYVRDQLGHSSIQVTVDVYGHLVPADNIAWTDALNTLSQSATPAQTAFGAEEKKSVEVFENHGAGEGNRTPDLRFTKPLLYRLSYAGNHQ